MNEAIFAEATYTLTLEGDFTVPPQVPVPAAVWLFGSGLLGLVGVARRIDWALCLSPTYTSA